MSTSVRELVALTDRETEIIAMAAHGLSNADIGMRLGITEDTVKTHIRRLFRKLGAVNRAHAVHLAHTFGIPLPSPDEVVTPAAASQPAEVPVSAAMYVIRVVDPADPRKATQIPLSAQTPQEADIRLRQTAGQVPPSRRVMLYRMADLSRPIARMQGFRV